MTDRELTAELQELGLTRYQSEAYVAAVKNGQAQPSELVDASGVPQGRIYDVLDDLEEMGLIEIRSQGRGKEVTAPSPATVLEDLKRRRVDELTDRIDSLSSGLERLYDTEEADAEGFVTMVSREETALRHVRRAIAAADWWLTVSLPDDLYDRVEAELEEALDRGVTVRLLSSGERSATVDRTYPDGLRVHHRTTADEFVAADRAYGVFSGQRHPAYDTRSYVITQEPNLVFLLQNYAETIWATSRSIAETDRFPRRYLDPWRAITDLRERLSAGIRFQARIEGHTTAERRADTWTGTVTGFEIAGAVEADYTVAQPTVATLEVELGDETATVGGWKATIEDIAAAGIELEPS